MHDPISNQKIRLQHSSTVHEVRIAGLPDRDILTLQGFEYCAVAERGRIEWASLADYDMVIKKAGQAFLIDRSHG